MWFLTRDTSGARSVHLRAVVVEKAEAPGDRLVVGEVVAAVQILSSIKEG